MNNIINLNNQSCNLTSEDVILLDTNVWIYLFYPLGSYGKSISAKYSSFYKEILKLKCTIIVPAIVVSEFFNTCIKFEFAIFKDSDPVKYQNFKKDFRGTVEYVSVVQKLTETIKSSVLKNSLLINDCFNEMKIESILSSDQEFDFNDKALIEICKKYNAKILTHDKDFKKYFSDFNLDILTFSNS
ncbi:type II toxin-antitoxin system VapC family toxin [Fusobacterium varium]|uniref:type II toxin-antitoxin system VapC family toxin n=1 Tax=Fusobacterium varium TaxID=856 RepID=UPI000E3FE38E|nr:type II toxin-antitoxin system VapC family toxin [Fusobacterium varium]RGJ30454.1 PIN domain-containing protein [Fusobacterium varium]